MREVRRASPRPHPVKCACSMVLNRFLPIFPALLWFQSLSNAGNVGATGSCFAAPKCNRGLEHGQPAQRTVFQVIFNGFPWVFDRSCSQSCQNGFPIVQLMFLYEARLVQEHHRHNWDPILAYLGPGGLKTLKKPIKVNVNPSKTIKTDHHICKTQVFGPRTWVRARCGHFLRDRQICFGNQPKLLKQVKLVASELRASPPKNEAGGFARGSEASETSSFGASRFAP